MFSELVYCVAIICQKTEWGEQWICIKFCIKLEHSSVETIQMTQKAVAMGNWWLAASSRWCTCSCITSWDFWQNIKLPRWLSPPIAQIWPLWLLAFPKIKITFEREEISDHQWNSGKYNGAADGDWENCVRSQGASFEGDWGVIVLCTMFLVSCIFFNRCFYFSYHMAGYLLDRPSISPKIFCFPIKMCIKGNYLRVLL